MTDLSRYWFRLDLGSQQNHLLVAVVVVVVVVVVEIPFFPILKKIILKFSMEDLNLL